MAFLMVFLGLGASPKATPTTSVPVYANVDCTMAAQKARNRPFEPGEQIGAEGTRVFPVGEANTFAGRLAAH